jgi:glycosyltransferase involved in cell wall biosynthesis
MSKGLQVPDISVITPVLNGGRFLEDAIQSVVRQDYPRFEHVVVDGGSTDGTLEILERHPHLAWISEPDRGQSDAMNKGFGLSTGDVVVYLNADDYFEPNAFRAVVPHFRSGARFVVGRVRVVRDEGPTFIDDPKVEFGEMLRWWEPRAFSCNSVGYFYLREVHEAVGGFNVSNDQTMDLEFLLEASRRFRFTKIDDVLGTFRMIPGTKTVDNPWYEYLGFCDRYLEYFDEEYVDRYLRDRKTALRQLARGTAKLQVVHGTPRANRPRFSVRRIAGTLRRTTRKGVDELFNRPG